MNILKCASPCLDGHLGRSQLGCLVSHAAMEILVASGAHRQWCLSDIFMVVESLIRCEDVQFLLGDSKSFCK